MFLMWDLILQLIRKMGTPSNVGIGPDGIGLMSSSGLLTERCEHVQIGPRLRRLRITDTGLNVKLRLAGEFELAALRVENHEAK